ncbi:MAG: aspartate kinase [Gammaproteobacteria bacterium]|nr:aspartate kinase [Gammaproteobacteria bacterium]
MGLYVQKFGGTSVADAERIRRVAARVAATKRAGNEVLVVVSAMGSSTDDLIDLANQVHPDPPGREMDMLLSAGERIAMSLLAMAIHAEGIEAVSFTGSQAGILTDSRHGGAKIQEIRGFRVVESLGEGKVVIVAGFQGVDPESKDVTTLGRGGTDTTAVALAAANHADVCEIYTDVDGVFTADPRLVPAARKLDEITFEEMLELASTGAKVLMARSVEVAQRFGIPLHVRSSFHDGQGSWVKEATMEQAIVRGISHDTAETKVTIVGVPDRPGVAASVFAPLADRGVNVDMIVQNVSHDGTTDISFTIPKGGVAVAEETAREVAREVGAKAVLVDLEIGRVSVVGVGMRSNPGIAARMFKVLADHGINIEMISTSSIRISCVIREGQVEQAVRALHRAFIEEESDG